MTEDVIELMKIYETYEIEHNIFCPFCNYKQSEESVSEHTTYHGEKNDIDKIQCCEDCGKQFIVEEKVNRTFKTRK